MTGYYIPDGYMGLIGGEYMLFATESDYKEYYQSKEDETDV